LWAGEYTITVIAKDEVNNQVQYTFTITVESWYHQHPDLTTDTDGDGMPDWWEQKFQLDHTVKNAQEDPDGDGFPNWQEYQNNTNPSNSLSHTGPPIITHRRNKESYWYDNPLFWIVASTLTLMVVICMVFVIFRSYKLDKFQRSME